MRNQNFVVDIKRSIFKVLNKNKAYFIIYLLEITFIQSIFTFTFDIKDNNLESFCRDFMYIRIRIIYTIHGKLDT